MNPRQAKSRRQSPGRQENRLQLQRIAIWLLLAAALVVVAWALMNGDSRNLLIRALTLFPPAVTGS